MTQTYLLSGHILSFTGNPFETAFDTCCKIEEALVIQGTHIVAAGPLADMKASYPAATHVPYPGKVIMAGFVDAHVHYPQTRIIASWGLRLIDWLNTYTFPEEMRLSDPAYAQNVAGDYLDLTLAAGTTTSASFCTSDPHSADAFFSAAHDRNLRVVAGKTCMDRNAPEGLQDTPQSAYDDSKALIERWHGAGRAHYAITPRFSPTSTVDQLNALGALWSEYPDCLMQTHLSEQIDEIAWVRDLFPQARDYLDTYEHCGLLGPNGLYGHAIHLEAREIDRLKEMDAALVHCPTSNTFIGSGLFDMAGIMQRGIRTGLATDTGGGSSFSMLRTMAAAYEVSQLRGTALHAAQLLWLATSGSARALRLDHMIGNASPGMDADLVVLDLASTPAIAQRAAHADSFWEQVFPTIMMGDDRAIADVWIAGARRQA